MATLALPRSPSEHLWCAAGSPMPSWPIVAVDPVPCATCGVETTRGVLRSALVSKTFSRAPEFLRFSNTICVSCAWMYDDPKRKHRSVLAIGNQIWWPAMGLQSASIDRPTWGAVIAILERAPAGEPVTALMTTNPKPRLWPFAHVASTSRCGMYLHAPEYDVSGYIDIDRHRLAEAYRHVCDDLAAGYTKRAIMYGIPMHTAFRGDRRGFARESELQEMRRQAEFLPALLAAYVVTAP